MYLRIEPPSLPFRATLLCTSPPPQFPDFSFSARNVYHRPLFQGLFTRNMPLPSLLQDLVECRSWIYCGRSLSGTLTDKSS